ncbi:MAG: phosphotransferase [Myxococcales bacterium]|nr:phosphotransferase [Myxococcales bacterium]
MDDHRPRTVPANVLAAYGLEGAQVDALSSLINSTFRVTAADGARAIVQRLHPIFDAEVNLDIEAITARLEERGLVTPRLLRTRDDALWVRREDGVWRAQSFIAGRTLHAVHSPGQARAAGEAVARFHGALDGFEHDFAFTRSGVHDTRAHLEALEAALSVQDATPEVRALAERIVADGRALPLAELAAQPKRLCHGDLKISNLRFAPDGSDRVVCLIDLDTLAYQSLAYELGDALRSWCNPFAEDSAQVALDGAVFGAALGGYVAAAAPSITPAELASCVAGFAAVALELASRFCRDVLEDRYFGWDPERFASRGEHNLARARSQRALSRLVADGEPELAAIVEETLAFAGRAI